MAHSPLLYSAPCSFRHVATGAWEAAVPLPKFASSLLPKNSNKHHFNRYHFTICIETSAAPPKKSCFAPAPKHCGWLPACNPVAPVNWIGSKV